MDVGLSADIVELGLGTKEYEADRKCRWFIVYLQGILRDGLVDVQVLDVKEFHNGKFEKESALDQFLVPYIYIASLEEIADDFTAFYCCDAIYDGYKLPVAHILEAFEIKYYWLIYRRTASAVCTLEGLRRLYMKRTHCG